MFQLIQKKLICLLIPVSIFLSNNLTLATVWTHSTVNRTDQLDRVLEKFQKSENLKKFQQLDGAIVVIHQGKVVYRNLFGYRKGKESKNTSETLFPLASASKPISAALIAFLAKQKKISFDDTMRSVVPGIDQRVLLKHILSHSSGYNDLMGNKAIESGKKREILIHLFDGKTPEETPGSKYFYSNVLFSLIEDLVKYKTQSTYESNLSEFLSKVGIDGQQICTVNQLGKVAFPHRLVGKQLASQNLPKRYAESVCSAAGLYLSVNQMSKFVNLMLGHFPEVLDKSDLERMFQPQVEVTDIFRKWMMKWPFPIKELKSYYASGWRILEHNQDKKNRLVFHSGHLNGITSFVGLLPEKDLGIVILSNQDVMYPEPLGMDFWKNSLEFLKTE